MTRPLRPAPWTRGITTCGVVVALTLSSSGQAPPDLVGMLDEHPSIQYGVLPTTDRVARLDHDLSGRFRPLRRDAHTGYLRSVLDALNVPVESQLLVFSKTGVQRDYTSPRNPRALYFDESVVVGYIAGAPQLELAAHDPRQGVVFYTLDQTAASAPRFSRRNDCLSCHVSVSTLEVPGMLDRSNMVASNGSLLPQLGSFTVDHRTPHTERWGGWFVTAATSAPPYIQLGNLGNTTVTMHPSSGPSIFSNHVFIDWLNSDHARQAYPSPASDAAALMVFDHQMHAMNLLTRLGWEARVEAAGVTALEGEGRLDNRVGELVDYLLFVGEAPLTVEVTPRPGFAEHLTSQFPKDRRHRSLADLELTTRLMRYPCSYMIYSEAFNALPPAIKQAVYARILDVLSGRDAAEKYAHLTGDDRRAILEILHETKPDFPPDARP